MPRDLPDRRHRLFGREPDLAALTGRVQYKGLTAVVARPQMGKSWLLTELARRLAHEHEPRHIVGVAESVGQTPDLLLRAIVDLYERWLSDAGYREQARMAWDQQKSNLLPGVARTVTRIVKEVGELAKPVTAVVEDAINGLVAANQTLTTGGIQLPALQYDQARDLVTAVARVSERPIALVLDQWEKSPDAAFEAKTLNAFLHHLAEWPRCHLFMALRPDEPAHGEVEKLARSLPGTAESHTLGEMDVGAQEGHRLTAFVRARVSAALEQSDEDLLGLVGGYPGVLYQWTGEYQRDHMQTIADLRRVADDAQNYRFSELQDLLPGVDGDRRTLALRLALLPLGGEGSWQPLKAEILDGLSEALIDDLEIAEVLDSGDPPSFGHAKRSEAARAWFVENRRALARIEAEALILRLASPVRSIDPSIVPNLAALWSLRSLSEELELSATARALCEILGLELNVPSRHDVLIAGATEAREGKLASAAPLLSIGLFDALSDAKAEDDLGRRDVLLDELRALAKAHAGDAAVRERLAKGLFNTLNHAKAEDDLARRDALLDELRALAGAHPEDAAVCEWLAQSLYNTLADATAEGDLSRRDALLDELRALAEAHAEDAAVRENLAIGLFNTLYHAKAEDDLARRDALLDELRALAVAHAEDAAVRENLAKGLVNTQNHARAEDDLARRDALLDELRALAKARADDAVVRVSLAMGLFNTLYHAKAEDDPGRRDALLDELRALAKAHAGDAAVREQLAKGLFNTLNDAKAEDDLARRDALLDELRALAKAHAEDAAVREKLANRLAKTMLDVAEEGEPKRAEQLRAEFSALAAAYPDDGWIEQFRSVGLL